jgi:hypothetical protein
LSISISEEGPGRPIKKDKILPIVMDASPDFPSRGPAGFQKMTGGAGEKRAGPEVKVTGGGSIGERTRPLMEERWRKVE